MSVVEIIEDSMSNGNSNVTQIEDSQLELYFRMHRRVNEKSEETSRSFKNNILVEFNDIEELHHKTIQSIKSLNPYNESVTLRVVITHLEGEAAKFNTFEAFKNHNKTSPNPTANVTLSYKFSIIDQETRNIEGYTVAINLISRIGALFQIEKEAPSFISSALISSILTTTAEIKIEYSDYVKARHFVAMFDEWIRGCDESKEVKYIDTAKSISYLIPKFGRMIVIAMLGFYVADGINDDILHDAGLVKFIVLYSSIFLVVIALSEMALKMLENAIDSYLSLSYININKGDLKLINNFRGRNKKSIIKSIFGVVSTIVIAVSSRFVYDFIKSFLS